MLIYSQHLMPYVYVVLRSLQCAGFLKVTNRPYGYCLESANKLNVLKN